MFKNTATQLHALHIQSFNNKFTVFFFLMLNKDLQKFNMMLFTQSNTMDLVSHHLEE